MHNLESRNCKLTKLKKLEGFGGEQHSLGRTRGMASLSNAAVDRRIRQWRRLWGRRGRENVAEGKSADEEWREETEENWI